MASLAALRTGAGLVTAAVPESIVGTVAGVAPELMVVLWSKRSSFARCPHLRIEIWGTRSCGGFDFGGCRGFA